MEPRDYTDDDFIDFDANELSVDEKYGFARDISNARISAAKLARRHSMNERTLTKYALRLEKKLVIYEKGGRPPALDEESMLACANMVRADPTVTDGDIRDRINSELEKTFRRRHRLNRDDDVHEDDIKKPSRWLYYRYIKRIRSMN
jgi:hypothetical protein